MESFDLIDFSVAVDAAVVVGKLYEAAMVLAGIDMDTVNEVTEQVSVLAQSLLDQINNG